MQTPPPIWSRSTDLIIERVIKWGVVVGFLGLVTYMLLPGLDTDPRPFRRSECKNNLKQIAMAMYNYHDMYGTFPPAYVADKDGRARHSWRVLLLPFLEYDALYKEYRFDEPWNGPHNKLLAAQAPHVYHCPSDAGTNASYFAVVGPNTVFPGAKSVAIKDIVDGTPNTILLVEASDSGINWLEPRDLSYVEAVRGINPKSGWGISSHHTDGAYAALADGSALFFPSNTPAERLQFLLERNDGKPVHWEMYDP